MKRSPMPPRKQHIKRKAKRMKACVKVVELHRDSKNIPFVAANSYFANGVPKKEKDVDDRDVCELYHTELYDRWMCWMCASRRCILEAHHIVSRSDEPCNIVMLCRDCHAKVQHNPKELPRVLLAKWTHDKMHADWRRIIELSGKRFAFDALA